MVHVIRRVPVDWQHPTDDDGDYIPLYGISYAVALAGIEHLKQRYPEEDYDEIYGDLTPAECFPEWDAGAVLGYCLYEIVTEGKPVSPVFVALEDLVMWVRDNFKDEPMPDDDAWEWIEAFNNNNDELVE